MKITAATFMITAVLLSAFATPGHAQPGLWEVQTSFAEGAGNSWRISPAAGGETIQFKARLLRAGSWVDWDHIAGTPDCTVTFDNDLVHCGTEESISFDYVSAGEDGWMYFEIDHPMSISVESDRVIEVDVEIVYTTIPPPGYLAIRTTVNGTFSAPVHCADFNRDKVINLGDASMLSGAWLAEDPDYDLNGDGVLDLSDISIMSASLGDACASASRSAGASQEEAERLLQQLTTDSSASTGVTMGALKTIYR